MKKLKYIKNTKGASSIEFVISLFIFILLFSFVFDLFFIAYRQYAVSKEANNLIRIVTTQSGVLKNAPNNFPGGDDNYLTVKEMSDRIKDKFSGMGITNYNVAISAESDIMPGVEKIILLPNVSSSGIQTDYRDYIKVSINYEYKWGLWSQLLPTELKGNMTVSRTGFSEYKFDYNDWDGEK